MEKSQTKTIPSNLLEIFHIKEASYNAKATSYTAQSRKKFNLGNSDSSALKNVNNISEQSQTLDNDLEEIGSVEARRS